MRQHHNVDGNIVAVDAETCYKIYAGTQVWLVIDGIEDKSIVTQKAVVYTDEDLKTVSAGEYHFNLPLNNKRAAWLIAKRDDVNVFERVCM